jgi:glutamyl-tRNA synthetase
VVRTRFAPSPTGALHVGNARIAVLNWLFTRQQGGIFILRIEDTDEERGVVGSEEGIFEDLRWLGLDWDEGPTYEGRPTPGRHAPYRQSDRLPHYHEFAARLRDAGFAYDCWCTAEEIEERRKAAIAQGRPATYDRRCLALTADDVARFRTEGRAPALRFRISSGGDLKVNDVVRGEVRFDRDALGDFILLRSDGQPTYNFAVVVDDILMEITHVIRGVGHLSNSPRQVLLYEALDAAVPLFAHVPTVLGPDRQKLSKRHGARSIRDYASEGYHPDALVNYLSLLSWSSPTGEEFLGRERLVEQVSLARIGVADVVFDPAKLQWLSGKHIERMPLGDLVRAVTPFSDSARYRMAPETLTIAVDAIRTHLTTFGEIDDQLATFFGKPDGSFEPPPAVPAAGVRVLEAALQRLTNVRDWTDSELKLAVVGISADAQVKGRALYEPLRAALTGESHGPPFVALLRVQGRDRVLARLTQAIEATRASRAPR